MRLYKLTKPDGTTHNGYQYGIIGKTHQKKTTENPRLCSPDVFHAYTNMNLAYLLNPMHADIDNPRLFEIEGDVVVSDGLKVGSFQQTVIRELPTPAWVNSVLARAVRAQFARACAARVAYIARTADAAYTVSVTVADAVYAVYVDDADADAIDFGRLADEAVEKTMGRQ